MDDFIIQYFKELRGMKRELLIVLGIIVGINVYAYIVLPHIDLISLSLFDRLIVFPGIYPEYLFALLMAYSIVRRERLQREFPLESYRLHNIVLIRFLVFVDASIVMLAVFFIIFLLQRSEIIPSPSIPGTAGTRDFRVAIPEFFEAFNEMFIHLSLVCTAWGAMIVFRRYRIFAGLAVYATGLLLFHILFRIIYRLDVPRAYSERL